MRRQRVSGFVVVLVLIFSGKIFSQQVTPRIAQISPHESHVFCCSVSKTSAEYFNNLIDHDKFLSPKNQPILPLPGTTGTIIVVTNQQLLSLTSSFSHPGFFCQKEYQFERKTSVPLRVRLGSLEYVDRMEGKK
jgi:hypothetical protein